MTPTTSAPRSTACALRWFADVSAWEPGSQTWRDAMQLLPPHEQDKVARFLFAKDQRLALASRVLQRRLISTVSCCSMPLAKIDIQRTPENKPYWRRDASQLVGTHALPATWNYNVSHHGHVVAIASHPHRLVGVDVVQLSERPSARTSPADFFRAFKSHFTPCEWSYIYGSSASASASDDAAIDDDDDDPFTRFYRLWSLKEAYIKAVGIGLGFKLLRAEFSLNDTAQSWELRLDGALASDWTFECAQLDATHLVTVALGPPDAMWKPATSSIFALSSAAVAHVSAAPDKCHASKWERKELADLLERAAQDTILPS